MSSINPDHIIKELKKHTKNGVIDSTSLESRMLLTMLNNCIKNQQITLEYAQSELTKEEIGGSVCTLQHQNCSLKNLLLKLKQKLNQCVARLLIFFQKVEVK